jgi:hypothetical protein
MKKGLFANKQTPNIGTNAPVTAIAGDGNYKRKGFVEAGMGEGDPLVLNVHLQKIYQVFKNQAAADTAQQNLLKQPYINKRNGLVQENMKLKQDNARDQQKINDLTNTLIDVSGKADFFIGAVILLFLTIYLFIFYSSASYSAFFKSFSLTNIGVAESIFDPTALSMAYQAGVTELILILTIPFLFLGLGYLIHKYGKQKNRSGNMKIAALICITFVFDTLLAYEITEKIYDLTKTIDDPSYALAIAFSASNFWIIIFSGFVAYLIWGFVFNFVMEAYMKMDKSNIDGHNKKAKMQIENLQKNIDKNTQTIKDNDGEIEKLDKMLQRCIIPDGYKQNILDFAAGWMNWMTQGNPQAIRAANQIVQQFEDTYLVAL